MKQFIIFLTFIVAIFVTAQFAIACPANDPYPQNPWMGPTFGTTTYTDTTTGTNCNITFSFCSRENFYTGLHEMALESISICGCDPSIFNQSLVDTVLWAILTDSTFRAWLGYDEIPFCPNGLCALKIYDLICYGSWFKNSLTGCWEMNRCDDGVLRSCFDAVVACYDKSTGERRIIRTGTPIGPPCKPGCQSSCE